MSEDPKKAAPAPRLTDPDPSLVEAVTRVMRAADKKHQTEGGSTRHYVRDLFLPMLDDAGIEVRSSRAGAERGTAEVETLVARLDAIRRLDPIDAQDADAIHRAREEGRRAGIEEAAKRLTLWRKAGVRVLSDGPQREALLDLASDAIAAVRALARGGSR